MGPATEGTQALLLGVTPISAVHLFVLEGERTRSTLHRDNASRMVPGNAHFVRAQSLTSCRRTGTLHM